MAHLHNLLPDIRQLLATDGWLTPSLLQELSDNYTRRMQEHFAERTGKPTLRMSKLGETCPCALWYSIHHPELAEPLPPDAKFKYAYGHMIEAQALCLAKAAGHEVTGEQDAVVVDGVVGHRDCVVDGCIVDVKSTSPLSFEKFKSGSLRQDDLFGYLEQLDGYLVGSLEDPLVRNKDVAYDWAIEKVSGHQCLFEHHIRESHIRERIRWQKEIVAALSPPPCTCEVVEDGKSGNMKLGVKASYNSFKHCCFPNLRTFIYSNGPRYLVKVVRRPMKQDNRTPIPEVDRNSNYVY